MRSWLIADGDDGDQWKDFRDGGVVRMTGRGKLGDLSEYRSRPEIEQALRRNFPKEFEKKSPRVKAGLCFSFGHEVSVGDEVFLRHRLKTLFGYGIAEAPPGGESKARPAPAYFFDGGDRYPHAIKVRWEKTGEFDAERQFGQHFITPIEGDKLASVRGVMGLGGIYPDEVTSNRSYPEGAATKVQVNRYERDPRARAACLARNGYRCAVCNLGFEERYGDIGRQFIHVHHLKPIAKIRGNYRINPGKDLVPVCPNCHAMLHRNEPPFSVTELKARLRMSGYASGSSRMKEIR